MTPLREASFKLFFDRGVVEEDDWLKILQEEKVVEVISAQKSKIDLDGEHIEFKNKDFAQVMRSNPKMRKHCMREVKKALYVEQDPFERDEEIIVEDLEEGEMV